MVYPHSYRTEHSETITTNASYGDYYAKSKSKKVLIPPSLLSILQYVDSNRTKFLEDLEEVVKIKSISGHLKYRDEVKKMIKFAEDWLHKLEIPFESFNIGRHTINGKDVSLPPVILASVGNDIKKKTCCVYLHLDVPDPAKHKWDTDPWKLTNIDNHFYGNGAACGKAPLVMWFHVVQAFKDQKRPLPVNLKFVIESMNHQNSQGFAGFVATRSQDFFANVDLVVETDSEWLGQKYPCLVYGTVGIVDFQITIEKTENSTRDIKEDMDIICKSLVDDKGKIAVKDFYNFVEQITPDEERVYENIKGFDPDEIRDSLPEYKKPWDKVKLLMSFWRLPSIIFDDLEECICDKKDFSVVKRKFLIKIVPRQVLDRTEKLVRQHFQSVLKKQKIENKFTCKLISTTRPWFENYNSPLYVATRKAILQVFKEEANLIREDRGRETVTIFDNVLEKHVILLPVCAQGSNMAEGNENISYKNFFEGTKLLASLLYQLGAMDK